MPFPTPRTVGGFPVSQPTGAGPLAGLQQYSSYDLSKVILAPSDTRMGGMPRYVIPVQKDTGRGFATENVDVTAYINQLQRYTGTLAQKDAGGRTFYGAAGEVQASPGSAMYDTPLQADPRYQTNPFTKTGANTYLQGKAAEFSRERPGYFQLGEDVNNRGNYNRGVLDTNNIAGSSDQTVADSVIYDPKYGYIAPNQYFKQFKPDFLNKYGPYLVLAIAGGAIAAGAIAGGGAAAAGGGSAAAGGGIGGVGGSGLTAAEMAALEASAASEIATGGIGAGVGGIGAGGGGSTFAASIGGTAAAGTGATFVPNVTSGAGSLGNSSGGSQGLFSQEAAPVYEGVPSSVGTGAGGAGGAGGGGGGGGLLEALGGGGGLLGSLGSALGGKGGTGGLIGSLLSAYLTKQQIDALKPQDKYTDYSSIQGNRVSLDPSIRKLQNESLAKTSQNETGVMGYGTQFRSRSDQTMNQYDDLYKELQSNSNPFIQARVDPLKASIAQNRGELQRGQGLRGVGGSSFANDELSKFDFTANRELGNATSTATQEALGARTNTLGSIGNLNTSTLAGNTQLSSSLNTLNNNRNTVARDRINQELSALGLSENAAKQLQDAQLGQNDAYAKLLQGIFGSAT